MIYHRILASFLHKRTHEFRVIQTCLILKPSCGVVEYVKILLFTRSKELIE
jgi:hypothetical protein